MEVNLHFVLYEDLSRCAELSAAADRSCAPCESQRHATEPQRSATSPSAAETVAHITIIRGTNPADVDFDLTDGE